MSSEIVSTVYERWAQYFQCFIYLYTIFITINHLKFCEYLFSANCEHTYMYHVAYDSGHVHDVYDMNDMCKDSFFDSKAKS